MLETWRLEMAFGREHEIARPSGVPGWLREFAEDALRRSADGSNPFQEIKNLFRRNKDLGAIEERVRELRDRIGLNLLAERDKDGVSPSVKTASMTPRSGVARLVSLANWLDDCGLGDEARDVDSVIRALASRTKTGELFAKYPKLKPFVDNVIRSRGGHVTVPAILKMIRDERPEESGAASDPALREYVEGMIKSEKREINDASDSMAGFGVGLSVPEVDLQEDNRMFEPSKPANR
jgi:hypothetical protein